MLLRKAYVNTPQGQIHVRFAGEQSRQPPLLLLHQTPSSSIMFETMMSLLSPNFWVLAPDLPGFGNSDCESGSFTVAGWARGILAMLDGLDVSHSYLFGHHTGASVAAQMAYEQPTRFPKIVLSGPPLISEEVKAKLWSTLPQMTLDESGSVLGETWQRIRQKDKGASLALSLRETLLSLGLNGRYHAAYQAVFDHDFAHQIRTLTCPILLVAGEHDSLRHSLEPTHALASNSAIKILPNAGTYVCDKQPDIMTTLIHEFFR
ncbi:MAG: alpha/beta hydrolase [Chloroflexota bacterium]